MSRFKTLAIGNSGSDGETPRRQSATQDSGRDDGRFALALLWHYAGLAAAVDTCCWRSNWPQFPLT